MIADIEPYHEYKESRLPWLGKVPKHWGTSRSKRLFSARKELALLEDVQLSATQAYGVIPQSDFEEKVSRRVVKISMHLEKRRHVEKDDFVISMRSFQGGIERAWASGAIRSSYVVLKPEPEVNVGFFAYLFKSKSYIRALQGTADFIRDGQDLNFSNFCSVDLPTVPLAEQAAIARYLHWVNGRIEQAIRSKRKLISLLGQLKSNVIHRAVTQGITPNVPQKLSGISWVKTIPEHWKVSRLKHLASINPAKSEITAAAANGPVTFLPMERVSALGKIDLSQTIHIREGRLGFTYMRDGDVIVAKITPCFENGKGAICTNLKGGIAFGSTEFHVLRPGKLLSSQYLYLLTRDPIIKKLGIENMQGSAGQQRVPREFFANLRVPFPPLDEQARVVEGVNRQLGSLDTTISRAEREIGLLREYGARVVDELVTGKLDVRAAVTQLPDQAELKRHFLPDTKSDVDLEAVPEEENL